MDEEELSIFVSMFEAPCSNFLSTDAVDDFNYLQARARFDSWTPKQTHKKTNNICIDEDIEDIVAYMDDDELNIFVETSLCSNLLSTTTIDDSNYLQDGSDEGWPRAPNQWQKRTNNSNNTRKRKAPPDRPRHTINILDPKVMPSIVGLPETYTKYSEGPCCLCGDKTPGKNGWRLGFCGPKSFCAACYQANTPHRRALFYTYDRNRRLVLVNQSKSWALRGFPIVFFASTEISHHVKYAPASRAKRFKNWI